jgi:hypothetical protein
VIEAVAFGGGLLGAGLLSINASPALQRTALALAGNWVCVLAAQWVTGDLAPWPLFILADAGAALIVLSHPASKPQAVIGVIYILQITFHIAYALAGAGAATALYLHMLSGGGWLQIATLAIGAIHHGSRKRRAARGGLGSGRALAAAAGLRSMESGR